MKVGVVISSRLIKVIFENGHEGVSHAIIWENIFPGSKKLTSAKALRWGVF